MPKLAADGPWILTDSNGNRVGKAEFVE